MYGESTKTSFWTFLLSMLTVAVMPAMFEEFSHRGMLLSGFSKISSMKAVVLSGLLFGLMHLNINQFFYAFVVGMLLATVALITRSIWPSVIIHFINNGFSAAMVLLFPDMDMETTMYEIIVQKSGVISYILLYLISVALFGIIIYRLNKMSGDAK